MGLLEKLQSLRISDGRIKSVRKSQNRHSASEEPRSFRVKGTPHLLRSKHKTTDQRETIHHHHKRPWVAELNSNLS